jgi:hypothetical protein
MPLTTGVCVCVYCSFQMSSELIVEQKSFFSRGVPLIINLLAVQVQLLLLLLLFLLQTPSFKREEMMAVVAGKTTLVPVKDNGGFQSN